jgi:hypothetical protein
MLSRVTFTSTGVVAASDTVSFTIRIEVNWIDYNREYRFY